MTLIVVGCNHRTADLALLERLAVGADETPKALDELLARPQVLEAAVLSTCNRVEVYAVVSRFHAGAADVIDWFTQRADVHPQDFDRHHYLLHDDRAAAHLFAVAGGLDSMVVGERQIGLQVRQAAESARQHGAARRVLQRVFRQAALVGRRLRAETDLGAGASSMVEVGFDVALDRWRALSGQGERSAPLRVGIVGAGKMGALSAARIDPDTFASATVWNRSPDKAHRLAQRLPVTSTVADRLVDVIVASDLVVCTTGAREPLVDSALLEQAADQRAAAGRSGDALVLLDLAVPRNVEPALATRPGVEVVDVADVRDAADKTVNATVLADAHALVDEEADRFAAWTRERLVDPTIRDLRLRAEHVRQAEFDRFAARLSHLDERERQAVEALTVGIVNTLLHTPTVRLREHAEGGTSDAHVAALRDLFDLDG